MSAINQSGLWSRRFVTVVSELLDTRGRDALSLGRHRLVHAWIVLLCVLLLTACAPSEPPQVQRQLPRELFTLSPRPQVPAPGVDDVALGSFIVAQDEWAAEAEAAMQRLLELLREQVRSQTNGRQDKHPAFSGIEAAGLQASEGARPLQGASAIGGGHEGSEARDEPRDARSQPCRWEDGTEPRRGRFLVPQRCERLPLRPEGLAPWPYWRG